MKRRQFIRIGGISAVASTMILPATAASNKLIENYIQEEKYKTPVKGHYDVIVSGAGPAGVVAAIEAARNGATTLLIELHGCLGGVWTSGLLSWILDQNNKSGILREIIDKLKSREAVSPIPTGASLSFDVEEMKLLLEELCFDAGVDIRLHTRVVGKKKDKNNRLTHVITESKSGREAWNGRIFIDSTGDGDLAARAGCKFDYGDPENNFTAQPFSLLAFVAGIKFDEIRDFVRW
jgi:flavin-dependent dehydrogenase